MIFNAFDSIRNWAIERGIYKQPFNKEHHIANMMEELTEGLRSSSEHEDIDFAVDNIIYAINYLEHKGYNARLCVYEGYLEISSRTGAYCNKEKKWKKFTTPEAKAKWYKANYELCRRES
jgi:hypothetical protein